MMRKIILAALAATALIPAIAPTAASAQSAGELRHDQRELRRDRGEIRGDYRRGDYREASRDRREYRDDRREYREDWRDYRRAHGDVYRRGAYRGPRGHVYRPVNVGYRFAPPYYARQYWINDPWRYRLAPPRYGYQRWVRYGNDVVLVDTRSGVTLQVFGNFFF